MKEIKLLIVDDNARVREVLERCLGEGRQTLTAGDGAAALDMTRRHLPDLVILDVDMPKRNGYEVCAELRADPKTRDIPILMLTGAGKAAQELAGFESGADDYMTKPFNLNELDARVRALLWRTA
jgi:DNA-binding response OmpR family regulator